MNSNDFSEGRVRRDTGGRFSPKDVSEQAAGLHALSVPAPTKRTQSTSQASRTRTPSWQASMDERWLAILKAQYGIEVMTGDDLGDIRAQVCEEIEEDIEYLERVHSDPSSTVQRLREAACKRWEELTSLDTSEGA
jgi:hypothetical protein